MIYKENNIYFIYLFLENLIFVNLVFLSPLSVFFSLLFLFSLLILSSLFFFFFFSFLIFYLILNSYLIFVCSYVILFHHATSTSTTNYLGGKGLISSTCWTKHILRRLVPLKVKMNTHSKEFNSCQAEVQCNDLCVDVSGLGLVPPGKSTWTSSRSSSETRYIASRLISVLSG